MMADGMTKDLVRVGNSGGGKTLTPTQFGALAQASTQARVADPAGLRTITRAHVIAWRKDPQALGALRSLRPFGCYFLRFSSING